MELFFIILCFIFLVANSWGAFGDTLGNEVPISDLYNAALNYTIDMDYQARALSLIPAVKHNKQSERHGFLCSTYIRWSQSSLEILANNIKFTSTFCDWLIVVYNSQDRTNFEMESQLERKLEEMHHTKSKSITILTAPVKDEAIQVFQVLCQKYVDKNIHEEFVKEAENPCQILNDVELSVYNAALYSKASLIILALEYLSNYKYIWVLDGDIDLTQLDLKRFAEIIFCSFRRPPIITQPLIHENTQFYRYLHRSSWKNSKVIATAVGFIEIQAPIFDTIFLEWFTLSFLLPLVPAMTILGGDWGIDEMFCTAAKEFSQAGKMGNYHEALNCMVPIDDLAVNHKNEGEIANTIGLERKREINFALMKIVHKYFWKFAHDGLRYYNDPFNRGAKYKKVYQLQKNCSAAF
jgi:hypothetical protein